MTKHAEPLGELPVSVHIDAGWRQDERRVIEEAIAKWNRLGEEALRRPFFELADPQPENGVCIFRMDRLQTFCESGLTGLWILPDFYELHWERMGFSDLHLGATWRCSPGGNGLPAQAVAVVNRVHDRGDMLLPIMLHELGHVLGLRHGCAKSWFTPEERAMCSEQDPDSPEIASVMTARFKVFVRRQGMQSAYVAETLKELQAGDMELAYCLYADWHLVPQNPYESEPGSRRRAWPRAPRHQTIGR